ncbi:metal ABC transporter solute-binding protein, Zn/Mn family [Sphaerotilus mobilis]|uniref:Zinc/manganese transport system substrate-binding protein n=1 Tax=Sphaerotilus mobilis TaxID=47994 RepID=A0A4Q7LG84_9BURK|nr:zinc ABC transporter substrate-binding protein [Sphaerotilus mobilis]RZS53214.1 zinc/manganese transport system substrate-binding protein [Sphaerotilus mobilis]
MTAGRTAGPSRRAYLGGLAAQVALASLVASGVTPISRAATPAPLPNRPLRLVASFSILADLLRQLAPPDAEVHALVGPEADTHAHAPTPADARWLAQADLLVANGLGFEAWLPRLREAAAAALPMVSAADAIEPLRRGALPDPHLWHDPARVRQVAQLLSLTLQRRIPAQAGLLRERLADFLMRLDRVDADARARLTRLPDDQRRFYTPHGGYAYLAAAYGLDMVTPMASTGADLEPSAAAVARLVTLLRKTGVRAVFVDALRDERLMRQIAQDSGAVVARSRLHGDALTRPGGEADSWLALMAHNTRALADALRGPSRT